MSRHSNREDTGAGLCDTVASAAPTFCWPVAPVAGEPRRFFVASRTPGIEPYLVDLDEYRGNGWCGCQDFEFRRQPHLERGAKAGHATRCFHVQQALAFESRGRQAVGETARQ
jgi:hypothetical protein